jgi:surface polysaccharide O-acyltransferase-like enzyme
LIGLVAICVCAVGVMVVLLGLGLELGEVSMARRYAISVVLICLSILRPGELGPVGSAVHLATFGIYLVHPLVIQMLHNVGLEITALELPIVYVCALALTVVLQRTMLKRFV